VSVDPSQLRPAWKPYREPLRSVILRNLTIAIVLGAAVVLITGRLSRWPSAALLALWPSFGGHWLEVFFLNGLRPRLPAARGVQAVSRISLWFAGGIAFALAIRATAMLLSPSLAPRYPGGSPDSPSSALNWPRTSL
jgi:hypothetical protein